MAMNEDWRFTLIFVVILTLGAIVPFVLGTA
jgi:hypothetical protein